jgi:hypothetical protein
LFRRRGCFFIYPERNDEGGLLKWMVWQPGLGAITRAHLSLVALRSSLLGRDLGRLRWSPRHARATVAIPLQLSHLVDHDGWARRRRGGVAYTRIRHRAAQRDRPIRRGSPVWRSTRVFREPRGDMRIVNWAFTRI